MLNATTSNSTRWTTVNVAVTNVIHQTTRFTDLLTSVASRGPALRGVGRSSTGEVVLPLRTASVCGVRYGRGLFVFVGRIRFERTLHIRCAPRRKDFRRAWNSAVEHYLQPCRLPIT